MGRGDPHADLMLVGVAGPDTAVPMGVVMAALALGALAALQAAGQRQPWRRAR